jgi:hypothetical protein
VLPEGYPYPIGEKIIISERTLTLSSDMDYARIPVQVDATIGTVYTVSWNDTKYNCVCKECYKDGETIPAVGNIGKFVGGTDTGEPFVALFYTREQAAIKGIGTYIKVFDGSKRITLLIEGVGVSEMDNKYLPDDIEAKSIILTSSSGSKRFKITVNDSGTLSAVEV